MYYSHAAVAILPKSWICYIHPAFRLCCVVVFFIFFYETFNL